MKAPSETVRPFRRGLRLLPLLLASCLLSCLPGNDGGRKPAGPIGPGVPAAPPKAAETRRVFGATYMTMVNPFFVALDDGIREIVEARGDKLVSYDPGSDQLKQIGQIEDLVAMGVSAIFVNPVDRRLVKPGLEAARRAGIPVINVDAPVDNLELVDCLVSSDNARAGALIAQDLRARLPRARIAIMEHLSARSAVDRTEGFQKGLGDADAYSVVARWSSEGNIEQALIGMETILRSGARVDAVMATNDPSAAGVIAALDAERAAGKGAPRMLVYGVDGAPYAKKLIAEGRMTATAAQSPVGIGRAAAEVAYRILAGEKPPSRVLVPVSLIDAGNVARYGVDGWQ